MLWSNFIYSIIKVVAYEALVSVCCIYNYDGASYAGECSELSLL